MRTTRRVLGEPEFQRLAATMLVAIVLGFRVIQIVAAPGERPWAYDFSAYWLAGRHLIEGLPLYTAAQTSAQYAPQAHYLYLYPPPFAALVLPLSALSPDDVTPAYLTWIALGSVFVIGVILAIVRLERLDRRFAALHGTGVWLLIGAFAALPPVIGELMNGNVHMLLLGLFGVGWIGLRRGDRVGDAMAGGAIGIAALIKIFPGLVVLWFLLTRRWRAAAWSVIAAVVVTIATLPMTGIGPWLDYPAALRNMAGPVDPTFSFAPTTWLTPLLGWDLARVVVTLAGLAATVWAARLADPRAGYAAAVLAALLVTPILWSHYVTIAVLPLLLGLASGVPLLVLGGVYVLLSTGNQVALGDAGFVIARVLPLVGLLLLATALLLRPTSNGSPRAAALESSA